MKKSIVLSIVTLLGVSSFAQKKFAQLDQELPTPNEYRNAAGAPGHNYYQQKADYKMNITIDDETQKLSGFETITYTNNSPDKLDYIWVQLEQTINTIDSNSYIIEGTKMEAFKTVGDTKKK